MTVDVITFGCRLNYTEAEVMRARATAAGLTDVVFVNTCAVTAEAVRQAAQAIRKVRRDRPSARIVVTGCGSQVETDRFAAMPEIDHLVGNTHKLQPETFRKLLAPDSERIFADDVMSVRETTSHLVDGLKPRVRSFVQIQNGCDHRCTFCIIPFARGPSRSLPAGAVVEQIRKLVDGGAGEVVLTGVDITSYGADLPGSQSLGTLVRQVLKLVPELPRLRLSSVDQVEADASLMAAFAEEPRLMPHLHLSLQSGDDLILKRMKRRHDRASSIAFCRQVRRLRPDVVFGADLIAGFPTETDTMFANSLRLVEECDLTFLHVFPFSPRSGTPAARMPMVAQPVVKERAARLRAAGSSALAHYLDRRVGATADLLTESKGLARTLDFIEVKVPEHWTVGRARIGVLASHDGRRMTTAGYSSEGQRQ